MANLTCANLLKVVTARLARLDDIGDPLVGASSLYTHDAPILVGYTPSQPDRDRFEQLNGNGDQCMLYLGPPKAVDSVTIRMDLCVLDAELIEMTAGGSLIISEDGYDTIGYLSPTDDTVAVDGAAFETWSIAWNGRQRLVYNSAPGWYRHAFPKVLWQVGEVTMQNGTTTVPLTGIGETNSQWGEGLEDDPFGADMGESVYGWMLDDDKPTGVCGFQAIAA